MSTTMPTTMPADRPPVHVVHLAFEVMVGCGSLLAAVAALGGFLAWRRRGLPDQRWYLYTLVPCGPLGLVAVEAGWAVTEVGRQPWIVRGLIRSLSSPAEICHPGYDPTRHDANSRFNPCGYTTIASGHASATFMNDSMRCAVIVKP